MAIQPYGALVLGENPNFVGGSTGVGIDPAVPVGKVLVVEHISGGFVVGENDVVEQIFAQDDQGGPTVFLPLQFAGSPFSTGVAAVPMARAYQFGSPARLYIAAQTRIAVTASAKNAGNLEVAVVGQFVDL